jgi:N-acetylglucosamine kinase-like BadF-type ATPase
MKRFFLGVDGGQSGTVALIADEYGNVLGQGAAGPCNHVASSEAEAKLARVVQECVAAACAAAGILASTEFQAACFGMSGGAADKRTTLQQSVAAKQWLVTDDAVIALSGALIGKPGVMVIAGTGSIALGRGLEGIVHRAGGWGYVFGDEGSAFDIVRQALRACLRAEEGWGDRTRLSDVLRLATGCSDMNAVLHMFYTPEWPRSRVAAIAAEVDACAAEGDPIATQLLAQAAQSLSLFAQSVARQIWKESSAVVCSYVGGVFHSAAVLHRYRALLELGGCTVVAPALGPAAGALIEAYGLAGVTPDSDKLLSSNFGHE